ncbi:hypothetical protein HAX54_006736 [Datura stramonium]|uniref:DUF4283 domain-containing protein n=1 Tax=Datura stramonium TaxID=4076 RepID=A0ABS8WWY2_DATST|nr:hypothetical protein [Datura stramonium]
MTLTSTLIRATVNETTPRKEASPVPSPLLATVKEIVDLSKEKVQSEVEKKLIDNHATTRKLDFFGNMTKQILIIANITRGNQIQQHGGMPTLKGMIRFVYGDWKGVPTPRVFLHNDGYYIFRFDYEENKVLVLQNDPYTFNS